MVQSPRWDALLWRDCMKKGWPDLTRTCKALKRYFSPLRVTRREAMYENVRTDKDFDEACASDLREQKVVKEAFALDTADRNCYENCMLVDIYTIKKWCEDFQRRQNEKSRRVTS